MEIPADLGRVLVIIPTYNERDNIERITARVRKAVPAPPSDETELDTLRRDGFVTSPERDPYPVSDDKDLDANPRSFGALLVAQWTGFARTGDPTVDGTPLWPRFTRTDPAVMSLVPAGDSQMTREIGRQHHCAFWNREATS